MNTYTIISVDYFKNNTPFNLNIDDKLLRFSILMSQDENLQDILGTVLYKKILSLVQSGDISLPANANYKTLVDDYIISSLIFWTIVHGNFNIRAKSTSTGVMQQTAENADAISEAEFNSRQTRFTQSAEFRDRLLSGYLEENYNLFPEYSASTNLDEISPSGGNYFGGLVVPKKKCKICYR